MIPKTGFEIVEVQSSSGIELIDITGKIRSIVNDSEISSGIVLIYTPHTTAGISINENADPAVKSDISRSFSKNYCNENYFKHMEGNSPSHILSSLVSASESVIIENGDLVLGTWQGIFFCEFDGPRSRKVYVKIT